MAPEDEATRHDGEEGVLEGGGDGSLGDEGVGERGGGANGHGGGELLDLGAVRGGRGAEEERVGQKNILRVANVLPTMTRLRGGRGAVIDERFLADRCRGGASTDGGRDIDRGIFRGRSVTYPGTRRRDRARGSPAWSIAPHPQISRLIHGSSIRGGTSKRRWRDSHLATAFTDTAFTAWTRLTGFKDGRVG